jgi:hypothetical protein
MSIDNTLHNIFGASKVAADVLVQEYGKYFGLPTGVFCSGCLTGPAHQGVELHGFLSYLGKCVVHGRGYTSRSATTSTRGISSTPSITSTSGPAAVRPTT